jgi:ABC-type antimicrobial peptide transport system permease subunit
MVFRNLWRRATRSLLTLLGIAVGVAAVIALGAMAQGLARNYATVIGGGDNELLVTQANAIDPAYSSLDLTLAQRLQAIPGVDRVEPGIYAWVVTEDMPFFLVFGYKPDTVAVQHYQIVEGKPITGRGQIAIGRRAAESLNLGVGDKLRLYGVPYQIVGIYETGQGMEESGGVVALEDAQEIAHKEHRVSLFQIGLRRNADIDQVISRIESLNADLSVSRTSDLESNQQWADLLEGYALGIAGIAILIGGLGMMNAMVMSVLERTREIGTLRAVGWSRWRVLSMILGESVMLSLIGGIGGVILGVGLTELAAQIPGVGAMLEGVFTPTVFAQGLGTAFILGLVGGAYPAWRAANLQPVEALRYEGGGADSTSGRLVRIGSQSFRNLWRRRNRTLVAATGIGIGVATLVMLGGITNGMISQLNQLAGSGSPGNITVMQKDIPDMSLSNLDERIVRQIQAMPQVKSVSPMVLGFEMSAEMPFFIINGLDPNSKAMSHYKLIAGRMLQRPNEIMVGKVAADSFDLAVGDTLTVLNTRYKVVGIYETGVAWEETGGVLALREAQRLLNRPRSVSYIFVDVANPDQAGAVRDAIKRRFPEVNASISSEFAQNTNDIAETRAFVGAIGLLAMIVGGIVVANTMIMSIYERTREIGTLRALGWQRRRILSQIVQESLLLCILAALIGSVLGVGLVYLITFVPAVGKLMTPVWDVGTFVQAIVVALMLGAIGGLYPAWRASRLKPVEALRYE